MDSSLDMCLWLYIVATESSILCLFSVYKHSKWHQATFMGEELCAIHDPVETEMTEAGMEDLPV